MLEGVDIVKFAKSLRLRWCRLMERIFIKNVMKGTRKRDRPHKIQIDVVQEDFKIMGIRHWQVVAKYVIEVEICWWIDMTI